MKFLSVCSGIEAASVAWQPLGWKAIAFSEIDKFPSAVLAHHWPDIPNLGDMTKYNEWTIRPNLIVGGTPCQSYSAAGLRKGLEDPRGNLTLVFLGMVKKFMPTWVVWENVPGVLSDKTNAFGQFVGGLVELGYDCAWRVLDAQHFGVPQRRRRVFLVANTGNRTHPAKVFFNEKHLFEDFGKVEKNNQNNAREFYKGPRKSSTLDWPQKVAATLDTKGPDISNQNVIQQRASVYVESEKIHGFRPDVTAPFFNIPPKNKSLTLCATGGFSVATEKFVRKLTPIEYERLQGFPDNHTQIPWNGKEAKDCPTTPRYKACGNSMAVPVMRWIGEQIQRVENECGK